MTYLLSSSVRLFTLMLASLFFFVFVIVTSADPTFAVQPVFDIVYFKSTNLEQVLHYKEMFSKAFGTGINQKICLMGYKGEYALVCDGNYSRSEVNTALDKQGAALEDAGFHNVPIAVQDGLFEPLYNVSYGIGRNLDALKKNHLSLSSFLGAKFAKNLAIEKTIHGNYLLVYRCHNSKSKAAALARKHRNLLKKRNINTSVTVEKGNRIVYGNGVDISPIEIASKGKMQKIPPEGGIVLEKSSPSSSQFFDVPDKSRTKTPPSIQTSQKTHLYARSIVKYPQQIENVVTGLTKKQNPKKKSVSIATLKKTNSGLEKAIKKHINFLRNQGRISRDENTGWMVYDLKRKRSVVGINENKSFQAASMIKPFVALAFFHQVKAKKIIYGPKSRKQLTLMIQHSNNLATNWVMKQVGGPEACDDLLHKYYKNIFPQTTIREYIPSGGRTYRNTAAPMDYARFLSSLWDDALPYSKEIRRLMALPGRDRIYDGTPIPKGTLVYNKTGSTAHLIGDMGILVPKTKSGDQYPYIMIGVIERSSRPSSYGAWMNSRGDIIREVSTLVYKKMKKEHQLR